MSWFEDFPPSKITENIWLGNYANASNLASYNPDKITAVLNVHDEPLTMFNPAIKYFYAPFMDGEEVPQEALVKCMVIMSQCLKDKERLLVHCAAGISRSPTMVAAFLHISNKIHFDGALDLIKRRRAIVGPAVLVLSSVRKLLGVYPHDGSYVKEDEGQGDRLLKLIRFS